VVGARKFLIAFNVNLDTSDVAIARRIARAVRFSSGGLPYVKAVGVMLASRNLAQVSMNLTDFEQTPIHVAYEAVRREAERHRVGIAGTEIIGLVPKKALEMATAAGYRDENLTAEIVLENRLAAQLSDAPGH
jgi:glutamate formiminotransferase